MHSCSRASTRTRSRSGIRNSLLIGTAAAALLNFPAHANPVGGAVSTGSASISSSSNKTTVAQKSEDVVINWSSFNVGSGQTTNFAQPNSSAIAVNRIGDASASQILGTLDANGRVVLINGNGVLFGKGAQVNVGSLIATSTDGSDSDVLSGKFTKAGNQNASIVNQGTITAASGGTVALVAPNVSNSGIVQAKLGTVSLGAANAFTVDLNGDGLISFAAQGDVNSKASAINTGSLVGANVAMTAHAAEGLATGVVTTSGFIQAEGVRLSGGTIFLDAGNGALATSGTLNAAGGAGGGQIETSGENVSIAGAISAGKGGKWIIDPYDLTIDAAAAATIDTSLNSGNAVELQTTATTISAPPGNVSFGAGDINIDSALSWHTSAMLTIDAYHSINILAPISITGAGQIVLQYNDEATDGVLNFGFTSEGSTGNISYGATNNGGTLEINTEPYTLAYSVAGLATDIATTPAGYFALASSYNASGDGTYSTTPITTTFTGIFNGLGNTISNLTINSSASNAGLFAKIGSGGTIENIGLVGGSVTDNSNGANVGGLVGYENTGGAIANAYATGAASGGANADVGGLVGFNEFATISDAYATGSVTGSSSAYVGGLVGYNISGAITDAYATGTVTGGNFGGSFTGGLVGYNVSGTIAQAYATGAVSSSGGGDVGGLVGNNQGTITDAYATGTVSGGEVDGGLAGSNAGTITYSFATGAVSGVDDVGGLAGVNTATITDGYWDSTTTRASKGVGLGTDTTSEVTTAQLANSTTIRALNSNGTAWDNLSSRTTPYLLSNPGPVYLGSDISATPTLYNLVFNVMQLQNINNALSSNYLLAQDIDATGTSGFVPIGESGSGFTGIFNGFGNTISNLTIESGQEYVGLFGQIGSAGTVENVGLVGGSVTETSSGSFTSVGDLAGANNGTIANTYATGTVSYGLAIGGLVGSNNGTITDSYATGSVTDTLANTAVGGLVGVNNTTITNSFATGAVTDSANGVGVGGLVAYNNGTIANAYATGAVDAGGSSGYGGGLVAYNAGTISYAYSTGVVSGAGNLGGLVGFDGGGTTYTDDYWDMGTSGIGATQGVGNITSQSGVAGETTTALQASVLPAGFSNTVWSIVPGVSYPYLSWQFAGTPQVIAGTVSDGLGTVAGEGVGLLVNGVTVMPAVAMNSGADGYYYDLLAPGTISAGGSNVLAYLASGIPGNTYVQNATGSIGDMQLGEGGIALASAATDTATILAGLSSALGSATGPQFLYNASSGFVSGASVLIADNASSFTIDSSIDLGEGALLLDMAGSVTQNSGAITASALDSYTTGGLSLGSSTNSFAEIATVANHGTGAIAITDAAALTVTGIISTGNTSTSTITLTTTGTGNGITINGHLTGGTVDLVSAGIISEAKTGYIDASTLEGSSNGNVTLLGWNQIGALGNFTTGTGAFDLYDFTALDVTGTLNTAAHTIKLVDEVGNLDIDGTLEGGTVTLDSIAGEVQGAGTIDAKLLNVTADTGIDLDGTNDIVAIGTDTTSSGTNVIDQH